MGRFFVAGTFENQLIVSGEALVMSPRDISVLFQDLVPIEAYQVDRQGLSGVEAYLNLTGVEFYECDTAEIALYHHFGETKGMGLVDIPWQDRH